MEVVVPVQDFHFDSTTTTPYVSAPSSPKCLGDPFDYYCHYASAPTSPSRAAAIYANFGTTGSNISCTTRHLPPSTVSAAGSFEWEEKPDTTKPAASEDDFEFDFSGQLEKGGLPPVLTTADELFEKGKIRPLRPPPRLQHHVPDDRSSIASSPRSPVSPRSRGLWSPRRRSGGGEKLDPFTAAMVEVTRDRGRERNPFSSSSSSRSRKGSRSLSPLRGGIGIFRNSSPTPSTAAASSTAPLKSGGSKKWRLRDLLLFRSASEGRATGNTSKDPLRKYTMLSSSSSLLPPQPNKRGNGEDSRNASFRTTDSNGSMKRGSGAAVSAHEMHYTANRAASEELKKKTPLPYRQGLFGCLRFNPAVNSITKGFNSYSFNRRHS